MKVRTFVASTHHIDTNYISAFKFLDAATEEFGRTHLVISIEDMMCPIIPGKEYKETVYPAIARKIEYEDLPE